jgi:hypothetical protein
MSVSQMRQLDFKSDVDTAVVRISAIVGAELPKTEFMADILNEEIRAFILDFGYDELTMPEIILAFRLNEVIIKTMSGLEMERVQFAGNHLSVSFTASVLNNYKRLRNLIDGKFKNKLDEM